MNPFSLIMQYKWQSVITLLLCLILTGIAKVYRQQLDNHEILQQMLSQHNQAAGKNQQLDETIKLLKRIQAAQLEQKALLAKLDLSRKAAAHVPPSTMKKFKSGHYRLSNGKTW